MLKLRVFLTKIVLDLIQGDLCAPNPCSNGGTCVANGGSLKCSCRLGFTGDLCQICDACVPNPVNLLNSKK